MGFFRPDAAPFLIERRTARRWRAMCPATLETFTGEWPVQLWDISETGARLHLDSPPPQGTAIFLRWADQRIGCSVAWTTSDMCGLTFEQPIDRSLVSSVSRLIGDAELPVATICNIPPGRKRSGTKSELGVLSQTLEVGPSTLVIRLKKQCQVAGLAALSSLTAAEEMFFFGSPLSHVLAYEMHLQSSMLPSPGEQVPHASIQSLALC